MGHTIVPGPRGHIGSTTHRTLDGRYQTLGGQDGEYNPRHFFDADPSIKCLVEHFSVAEINALNRGGHDSRKLYGAFAAARAHRGQATVTLAMTKKGCGVGPSGGSRMASRQERKLETAALRCLRERFNGR